MGTNLLLNLLLLLLLSGGGSSSSATGSGTGRDSTTTGGNGGKLGRAFSDELRKLIIRIKRRYKLGQNSYLSSGLALELRDELGQAFLIGVDADDGEELLDISSGGVGVATGLEEKVCSNVTHLQFVISAAQ